MRTLSRGLDVLGDINRSRGARAGEVARRLGLPRPTVYRLLETLEQLGFVQRSATDQRFRVTRRASGLGDGYDAGVLVGQVAGPVVSELSQRLVWPIDLSIYENAAMVIEETTHARSPMSIDRGMVGRRLPILRTSAGRIYLASCGEAERQIIIRHLRRLDEPADRPFLETRALDRLLAEANQQGFATRDGGDINPKTSSLAAAIRTRDAVLGCISIIWINSGLSLADAKASFVTPLRQAADKVAGLAEGAAVGAQT